LKVIRYVGAGLLILGGLAWLTTFPVLGQLNTIFSGKAPPTNEGVWAIPEFFRTYPQIIWFGLILGSFLWFFPRLSTDKPAEYPQSNKITGQLPPNLNQIGKQIIPFIGIIGLAIILLIAANLRISDSREIGSIDLIKTDYDEGVHASAALLMAQGKTIYRDFFLTQPPVGPFLWSLPLRLQRAEWGSLDDFLRLRLFTSILALITVAAVYLIGRKLHSIWAGLLAALVFALDGGAIRADQQIMLEPLINFFTALAILAFVSSFRFSAGFSGSTLNNQWQNQPNQSNANFRYFSIQTLGLRTSLIILAGIMAGLAVAVKIPAGVVVLGLAVTLIIWHKWRALLWFGVGSMGGWAIATVPFLLTGGTNLIKQAYLYQLLRPFNDLSITNKFDPTTTLTAFSYMTSTAFISLTIVLSGVSLLVLIGQWLSDRNSPAVLWLPVVLVAIFTLWLYTGKAGFFPHYYGHLALPLALLAGGVITIWRQDWLKNWFGVAAVAVSTLVMVFIAWTSFKLIEPSKPQWSLERATVTSFNNLNLKPGTVFSWDARYTFVMGRPMSPDGQGDYFVDSAAAVEYLALGLEGKNLFGAFQQAVLDPKPGDLRFLRRTPLVQQTLLDGSTKADFVLLEARADSQLMPETVKELKRNLINRLDDNLIDIYSSSKQISFPSGALFGETIRLVGFDLAGTPKAGEKLNLTLYWRGEKPISEDYTIFVHLLDKDNNKVAQRDTQPRYGALPTTKWETGALFDDNQSLDLPADLPPGNYTLVIGIYRPSDFFRLPISEQPPEQTLIDGNALVLGQIEVGK
jgi:Dolichyl-phosphate-mannose-protein mannosyltransferase